MNQLDTIYRAFAALSSQTASDGDTAALLDALRRAPGDAVLDAVVTRVTVDEDWISAIEDGIPHLKKAIAEERQFIKQDGDVVPIEKVRQTSRSTVEHLARHSEYITRLPEEADGDLIPDRLLAVEKLTNYAVYENRFLYLLLLTLRDFIAEKWDAVTAVHNRFCADLSLGGEWQKNGSRLTVRLSVGEQLPAPVLPGDENDPAEAAFRASAERVGALRQQIDALLISPLMHEVSGAPLLQPPIVRTNALRMDHALRECMALYDRITAYGADGYTVTEERRSPDLTAEGPDTDLANLRLAAAFLTYEYGNALSARLAQNDAAIAENDRRRQEEERKAELNLLRARYADGGEAAEYIAALEARVNETEARAEQNAAAAAENDALQRRIAEIEAQVQDLTGRLASAEEKCLRLNGELTRQAEEFSARADESAAQYAAELGALRTTYDEKLSLANGRIEELTEAEAVAGARLRAAREEQGLTDGEDLATREGIRRLALEKKAIGRLYSREWKRAKKRIRGRLLWNKTEDKENTDENKTENGTD